MESVYIRNFQVVLPRHRIPQDVLTSWISNCHRYADSMLPPEQQMDTALLEKLFLRYSVKPSMISQRHFDCNDVEISDYARNEIFRVAPQTPAGVDIEARTRFFEQRADEVFGAFYPIDQSAGSSGPLQNRPDHLVHVTCTGYVSPSAAQKIVTRPDWKVPTAITHAYHMGCYASLPAVRLAAALAQDGSAIDVAHNEMCGLHMNPTLQTPEQFVVQTLFADGHVKYSVSTDKTSRAFRVRAIVERVLPDSANDMTWLPTANGLQMTLSREIPMKVRGVLENFSKELFDRAEIARSLSGESIFAIHPGGPKIIDAVQEALGLRDDQIRESRKILFERGNMSSATLPHVWDEILRRDYASGTKVISFAFGPGLTLFGAIFEVV